MHYVCSWRRCYSTLAYSQTMSLYVCPLPLCMSLPLYLSVSLCLSLSASVSLCLSLCTLVLCCCSLLCVIWHSILRHSDFHAVLLNLLLATEKRRVARFLLHLYLIQGFSDSFLILPFYKTIKYSHCKLWFCALAPSLKLDTTSTW